MTTQTSTRPVRKEAFRTFIRELEINSEESGGELYESQNDYNTNHVCSACHRIYRHRRSLMDHQRYECGKEPQFPCPFCLKRFTLKGNLTKHIHRKHNFQDKMFRCPLCAYGSKEISSLKTHITFNHRELSV